MLKSIRNPPTPAWKFTLAGIKFTRQGEEPFIYKDAEGHADLDMEAQRSGFVNRILRYAKSNGIAADEQDIFYAVYQGIAGNHRESYFSGGVAGKAARVPGKREKRHGAPIPEGLIEAARREMGANVAAEDDGEFLAELNALEWIRLLGSWIIHDPDPKDPHRFGPVFWYALHTLAITMNSTGFANVRHWISRWHQMVPCVECRSHFSLFPARRPVTWRGLRAWADASHRWVTQNK